jgi:hypothetical protein
MGQLEEVPESVKDMLQLSRSALEMSRRRNGNYWTGYKKNPCWPSGWNGCAALGEWAR